MLALATAAVAAPACRGPNCKSHHHLPVCAKTHAKSQHQEDLKLLLPLLCMAGGKPGSFVELGAFRGIELSNTYMYERCFGWSGVLIEGNPINFAALNASGRTSTKVHSAVCGSRDAPDEVGTVAFSVEGGERAGEPALRLSSIKEHKRHGAMLEKSASVDVPCRTLQRILEGAGRGGADILFLDVEGAEAKVLSSIDPAAFKLILLEAADPKRHRDAVEPLLLRAGFKREPALEASSWNPVYVRGGGTASAAISPRCVACEHDHACRKEALKEAMPACDPLLEICH